MDSKNFRPFFQFHDLKTEIVEGDVERVVYTGANLQMVEYHFPANKKFTAHKHDEHEQMGYLVKGKMGFLVGEEIKELSPGEFYHAQIGQMHNGWTFDEPSVLLDVFSPPRDDIMECSNHWTEVVEDGQERSGAVRKPTAEEIEASKAG